MIEKAMAMVSSCDNRLSSLSGVRCPLMRSTGWLPTLRCRSEALRSVATFSRSLMCIDLPPRRGGRPGDPGRLESRFRARASQEMWFVLWVLQGREPVPSIFGGPGGDGVEGGLQPGGDRAPRAAADRGAVDAANRGDFGRRAAEEDLVGDVEHLARDVHFDDRNFEILSQFEHRGARDSGQDRGGQRG